MKILKEAQNINDFIIGLRRVIHQNPELKYEEFETAKLIQKTLADLNIHYESGIGTTGVVGHIGTGHEPCVALRADMDALCVDEQNELPFKSQTKGLMHACGHDCHTAMLLGAAKLLKKHEKQIKGTVKLIFQPAEEGGAGAAEICKAGILDKPKVSAIFGLHVFPGIATGKIASRAGVVMGAMDLFNMEIKGIGGHGGSPHLCKDPVLCAAKIVIELRELVAREIDPLSPATISIGSIHGGRLANVIPDKAEISGTIRTLSYDDLIILTKRVSEISSNIAKNYGCEVKINFPTYRFPPVENDKDLFEFVSANTKCLIGADNFIDFKPVVITEDFSLYGQKTASCFAFLGITNDKEGLFPLHHPKFTVDESALHLGAAWYTTMALKSFNP